MHNVIATPNAVNDSGEANPLVSKKQLAVEQKARREEHLLCLIEGTMWQNLESQKSNHSVVPETTSGKKMFQRTSLLHAQYAMESVMSTTLSAIRILMQ